MDTLKEFILAEMHKRSMSEREFSRLVGVAHEFTPKIVNTPTNYLTVYDFAPKM